VIAETFSTAEAWMGLAGETERLGYDTLLIRDHFIEEPFGHQFAPFTALMAAAMVTRDLRLGTLVIDNDYRHPSVLAKEAATLDLLSGGRLEIGLGAGWLKEEYERTGIAFDGPGARISRLEEAVCVLRGLLAGGAVSHRGEHYQLDGLENFPCPAQTRVPWLIGGGSPRILRIAGREADMVGILTTSVASGVVQNDPDSRRSDAVRERLAWVREGAGERFRNIELSLLPTVIIAEDRIAAIDAYIRQQGWSGVTLADVWDMPSVLVGSVDQVCEQLIEIREGLGFSYFIVSDRVKGGFAPVVEQLGGR
jgi:probable F420-dependent oxidoreductase